MDHQRFDALTRSLARGTSRRRLLKGLLGGLAGGAALGSGGKVLAEDPEEEVLDQATEVTEEPPPDTTVEEPLRIRPQKTRLRTHLLRSRLRTHQRILRPTLLPKNQPRKA